MAQKVFIDPIKYVVGTDITEEAYQRALAGLTDWYAKTRSTTEPGLQARQDLQECLDGKKQDGTPWHGAWKATLSARVRIKCRYDLEKEIGLEQASEARKAKKTKERERVLEKRKTARLDPHLPPEVQAEIERQMGPQAKNLQYGQDPTLLLSSLEQLKWNELKDAYLHQFPDELSSVAATAELETLCDLHILNERHRVKMLKGTAVDPLERQSVVKQLDTLKTSLGIHPNQLAKRTKSKDNVSISAAAAMLDLAQHRKLRARFFVEEMLQLFQMYQSISADGLSYQLNDIELFGATRCRSCACANCGTRNFVGISIDEIEAWLKKKGVLRELPEEAVHVGNQ